MSTAEAADTALGINLDTEVTKRRAKPRHEMKISNGATDRITIILEDNEAIPPTGLFLAHNGRTFLIQVGKEVNVPSYLLEVLDHAVMSIPTVDQESGQVIGYRERMRYPYRVIRSPPGA